MYVYRRMCKHAWSFQLNPNHAHLWLLVASSCIRVVVSKVYWRGMWCVSLCWRLSACLHALCVSIGGCVYVPLYISVEVHAHLMSVLAPLFLLWQCCCGRLCRHSLCSKCTLQWWVSQQA